MVGAELLNLHYGHTSSAHSAHSLKSSKSDLVIESSTSLDNLSRATEGDSSGGARRPSRQSVQDQERWGGRYALAKSKLILVVHNICGDALSSALTQQCLSLLASCKSVAVLATVENLNSVAHWDRRVLARYHWSYHHTPTFEHARIPHDGFPLISTEMNGYSVDTPEGEEQEQEELPLAATEVNLGGEEDGDTNDYFMTQADSEQRKISKPPAKPSKAAPASTSVGLSSNNADVAVLSPRAKAKTGKGNGSAPQLAAAAEVAPSRAAVSLAAIKKSVTGNHNNVLEALVRLVQEKTARREAKKQAEAAQSSSSRSRGGTTSTSALPAYERSGVTFNSFFTALRGQMVVKSTTHLEDLLKEFMDHGVVEYKVPQGATESFVYFKSPYDAHLQNNLVQKVMSKIGK